eukprot:5453466-Amphidinium_carterae.1
MRDGVPDAVVFNAELALSSWDVLTGCQVKHDSMCGRHPVQYAAGVLFASSESGLKLDLLLELHPLEKLKRNDIRHSLFRECKDSMWRETSVSIA